MYRAKEMAEFSTNEFLEYVSSLSINKMAAELRDLGWADDFIFKKEFLKAYFDLDGKLQNFNAIYNKIVRVTFVAD